jgi:hypothetical protein
MMILSLRSVPDGRLPEFGAEDFPGRRRRPGCAWTRPARDHVAADGKVVKSPILAQNRRTVA